MRAVTLGQQAVRMSSGLPVPSLPSLVNPFPGDASGDLVTPLPSWLVATEVVVRITEPGGGTKRFLTLKTES